MLVPDEIRKCVAFAAIEHPTKGPLLCGTVFVGGIPLTDERTARVAITAAHVLDGARKAGAETLQIRFSRLGGGFTWIATDLDDWYRHPSDPTVDCAAIPLAVPADADVLGFRLTGPRTDEPPGQDRRLLENWVTKDAVDRLGIGPGDEVFFPGLFVHHPGSDQNIPIVRSGTIAAMPAEKVDTERGPMDAYLIEARSIGGLSGSPIFVQVPRQSPWEAGPKPRRRVPFFFFLGLVHGHWHTSPIVDSPTEDGIRDEVVNMGVAIAVPAQRIMEMFELPPFGVLVDGWRKELAAGRAVPPLDADH